MTTRLVLIMGLLIASNAGAVTLSREGKSDYVIVISASAIPAEQTAAQELADHLKKVTGAAFPIKSEQDAPAAHRIFVGLFPNHDQPALGHDGIVIKTIGDDLILAGGR